MQTTPALLLAVAAGSGLGGFCRHLLTGLVDGRLGSRFPVGTLAVNATGAFAIGAGWAALSAHPLLAGFLLYGFLGGYTTVSTFAWNTLGLWREDRPRAAAINAAGSVALCLAAAWAGTAFASLWHP